MGALRSRPLAIAAVDLILLAGYTGLLLRYGDIMVVQVLTLLVYFAFGASAYLVRDRIPMSLSFAALAAVALLATLTTRVFVPVAIPCIAYLTLFTAMRLPLRGFDRRLDLSYGLYIYAFPVQQLLALYGVGALGFAPYFLSALAIAGALAAASWFAIEKPSLSLKHLALPTVRTDPADATLE
jgi:peptidoglycan/LPS O-acetylase OafA/YrhL